MGIYISGMKMPNGRPVCIVIDAAGQARRYDLYNDRYADDKLFEAISVPQHGRLGDLDALEAKCTDEKGSYFSYEAAIIGGAVSSAKTIIPAEPPKEATE